MSFIKNFKEPEDCVGKQYPLIRDCSAIKGIIPKGNIVLITGFSNRGFDIKDIESGEELIECGLDCIDW